jgi:hypothetical protein
VKIAKNLQIASHAQVPFAYCCEKLSRGGALQGTIGPASSITDGLECNCRKCRKQRLPAHRSEEKLARFHRFG